MSDATQRILVGLPQVPVRAAIIDALAKAGYDAIEAADPASAWRAIETPQAVQLVLADIELPGFGGIDLATGVRDRVPMMPLLFVTDHPDEVSDRALSAPCYILANPVAPKVVLEVVARLLAARADR